MAEMLSQAEIDALLSSVSAKEEEPAKEEVKEERKGVGKKAVRVYDFTSPDKFSKDQIRTLQMIHENFTRLVNTSLSAYLRSVIQVTLVEVRETSYDEFIRSLPGSTVMSVSSVPPLEGSMIVEMTPKLIFSMFDRLLGGKGEASDEVRELTDIEHSVVEGIFGRILTCFKEAWLNIITLTPRLEALENNPQFSQIVSPNERVAALSFEVRLGEIVGVLNLCLPHVVLEPIVSKLSAQLWFAGGRKKETSGQHDFIKKRLENVTVPMIVQFKDTKVNVRELLELQVGDVIRLDNSVSDKLIIKIGNRIKYEGQPGVMRGKLAVQIVRKIYTEGEMD